MITVLKIETGVTNTLYADFDIPDSVRNVKKLSPALIEEAETENRSRSIWMYLSLGIPLLINALALLVEDLMYREKASLPDYVFFKTRKSSLKDLSLISRFFGFNERKASLLTNNECNKTMQLFNQTINQIEDEKKKIEKAKPFKKLPADQETLSVEEAKREVLNCYERLNALLLKGLTARFGVSRVSSHEEVTRLNRTINALEEAKQKLIQVEAMVAPTNLVIYKKRLEILASLLEKNNVASSTRFLLDADEWEMIDFIDFEVGKEQFQVYYEMLSSPSLNSYPLIEKMKSEYFFDYHEALVGEGLALTLAYIQGCDGKNIQLPVFNPQTKQFDRVTYTIKSTTIGDALPCYYLESDDAYAKPWFIVRGTQGQTKLSSEGKEFRQGAFESIVADIIDHKSITRHIINKALVHRPVVQQDGKSVEKESIGDLFTHWQSQGKKVNLAGHSLGGTLCNALTVEFPDIVNKTYTVGSPGVSARTEMYWKRYVKAEVIKLKVEHAVYIAEIKDKLRRQRKSENEIDEVINKYLLDLANSKIINFCGEGDLIPSSGKKMIGLPIGFESKAYGGPEGFYFAHIRSHLNRDFLIFRVDATRECEKLARFISEQIRVLIGKCYRLFLVLFKPEYIPDWLKNEKDYKKKARQYRKLNKEISTDLLPV